MTPRERRDGPCSAARGASAVAAWARQRRSRVSRPLSITQALNGLSAPPVCLRKVSSGPRMNSLRAEDDAAEAAALAVDVLGRGVDDDVGAEIEAALEDRRGEDVVDDHLRADGVGESRKRRRCR